MAFLIIQSGPFVSESFKSEKNTYVRSHLVLYVEYATVHMYSSY